MHNFKEFTNKNIKDFLQPKSDDDIRKVLDKDSPKSPISQIISIAQNNLSPTLLPEITRKRSQILILKNINNVLGQHYMSFMRLPQSEYKNRYEYAIINVNDYYYVVETIDKKGVVVIKYNKYNNKNVGHKFFKFTELSIKEQVFLLYLMLKPESREDFMNENIRNFLKPKSEEEIKKNLHKLNVGSILIKVANYNLGEDYLPSDKKVRNYLEQWNIFKQVEVIKRLKLPDRFIPLDIDITRQLDEIELYKRIRFVYGYKLGDKFLPDNIEEVKKDTITKIKKLIQKYNWKIFDHSKFDDFKKTDKERHLIHSLKPTEVEIVIYDKWVDEISRYTISYEDLDINNLSDIYYSMREDAYFHNKNRTNESISSVLKGKSDEEIRKEIEDMNDIDRISKIQEYDMLEYLTDSDKNDIKYIANYIEDKLYRKGFMDDDKLMIHFLIHMEPLTMPDMHTYMYMIEKIDGADISIKSYAYDLIDEDDLPVHKEFKLHLSELNFKDLVRLKTILDNYIDDNNL